MPKTPIYPAETTPIESLTSDIIKFLIGPKLSNQDMFRFYRSCKSLRGIFQPRMDVWRVLACVVEADIDNLLKLVKQQPRLLFQKGDVQAPRKQVYYNVSPYQLITFLRDSDMRAQVLPLIPQEYEQLRQEQDKELGRGGADIVKINFDPLALTAAQFKQITEYTMQNPMRVMVSEVHLPLLKNPDGLLYWEDNHNVVNFYYANRDTQQIVALTPLVNTPEERLALQDFKKTFDDMEDNSARRSSDNEHQLIARIMQQTLHREGISYSTHGKLYRDSQTPFRIINCYQTYISMYSHVSTMLGYALWIKVNNYWKTVVGMAQGEEMWLLKRFCGQPAANPNFIFVNRQINQQCSVFTEGKLTEGLGKIFALSRHDANQTSDAGYAYSLDKKNDAMPDLATLLTIIAEANEQILKQDQNISSNHLTIQDTPTQPKS